MSDNLAEIILIYVFRLLSFGFLAFFYFCFRQALEDRIIRQRNLSHMKLDKLKKGIKNYWFLKEIHKQVNLGFWYKFNFIYIVLYTLSFIPFIFIGFIPIIGKTISCASLILYPMALIMDILWCIEHNLSTHKKAFVLLAKDKARGKIDSVFIDFIGYIFILMLCYSQIKLAFS